MLSSEFGPVTEPVGAPGVAMYEMEDAFGDSFRECQTKFRNVARRMPCSRCYAIAPYLDAVGPDGEDVCTDVCVVDLSKSDVEQLLKVCPQYLAGLGRAERERCGGDRVDKSDVDEGPAILVHTSGTHGVEGFAGSAIQVALLSRLLNAFRRAGIENESKIVEKPLALTEKWGVGVDDDDDGFFAPFPRTNCASGPGSTDVPVADSVPVRLAESVRDLSSRDRAKAESCIRSALGFTIDDDHISVRLVFVHAINPTGHAFSRRWTGRGVDLNRNWMTEKRSDVLVRSSEVCGEGDKLEGDENEHYDKVNWVVNPPFDTIKDEGMWFWPRAAMSVLTLGYSAVRQAIAGGQRSFPTGIWYGGLQRQPERAVLEAILLHEGWLRKDASLRDYDGSQEEFACKKGSIPKAVHIDVHTGLGPPGRDSLLCNDFHSTESLARLLGIPHRDDLPMEKRRVQCLHPKGPTGVAFVIDSDSTKGTAVMAGPTKRPLTFAQEFGTVPNFPIFFALRTEGARTHAAMKQAGAPVPLWELPHSPELAQARRAVRDAFYLTQLDWKRHVVQRGVAVAESLIGTLFSQV